MPLFTPSRPAGFSWSSISSEPFADGCLCFARRVYCEPERAATMDALSDIQIILRDDCQLVKDRPILVGVSGGPDSLCLLHLLLQAGYLPVVGHFDHQLRADSQEDARQVEAIAGLWGLPFCLESADVGGYAAQTGKTIEEAARALRYQALFRMARSHQAQAVAVGHTADDQVETILMHFVRGSGLAGLKGMLPHSILRNYDKEIPLVRPLLQAWRIDILSYCHAHGLQPLYDPSNDSLQFQRNRMRRQLIPILETYNPGFRQVVQHMSIALQGDTFLLDEMIAFIWREALIEGEDKYLIFDLAVLAKYSAAYQRNLIKRAMQTLLPEVDISFATLDRAVSLLSLPGQFTRRLDLKGGLWMFLELNHCYICTADADLPVASFPQLSGQASVHVPIPAYLKLGAGWVFECAALDASPALLRQVEANQDPFQGWLDAEHLTLPLVLRSCQPGDRFAPLGLNAHRQKLSDIFINQKIPRRVRPALPLLASGTEILWVPCCRPGHSNRLTSTTRKVIHCAFRHSPDRPK